MSHFDSTIRAGYYDAFQLQGIDHTYAMLEHNGELWAFPCFGGVALPGHDDLKQTNVRYPVDLWTPYAIGSRNAGSSLPANLHVALGMAQFRTNPAYNFRLSEWKEYWKNAIDGAACWAGIVYGVSGVCQQACNRVLWASRSGDFTESPVNWPPSFSSTYWVYGYYGKTSEDLAVELASQLVREAQGRMLPRLMMDSADIMSADLLASDMAVNAAELPTAVGMDEELRCALGKSLLNSLGNKEFSAERREDVRELVAQAPSGEKVAESSLLMSGLLAPDARFFDIKQELDKQLLRGELSNHEYAKNVNRAYSRMLEELQNVLPPSTFQALFPKGSEQMLVLPSQMPQSYDAFQEVACV